MQAAYSPVLEITGKVVTVVYPVCAAAVAILTR